MAKQTFQVGIDFIANVTDLQSKIKNVTGDIAKMGSTSGGSQIQKQFDQLTRTVENLHTRTQQPIGSQAEFNKLAGDVSRAEMAYDNLIGSIERLKGLAGSKKLELLDPAEQKRISDAANAVKTYENATAGAAQKQKDLERAQERVAQQKTKIAGLKTAQQEAAVAVQRHKDKLTLLEASQEDVINAEKRLQQATEQGAGEEAIAKLALSLQQAKTQAEELGVKFTKNSSATQAFSSAIERTNKDIDKLGQSAQNLALAKDLGTATAELDRLQQELQQLQGENPTAQLQSAFEQLKTKAQSLGVSLEGIDDVSSIEQLKERLLQLKQQGLDQVDSKIDSVAASMNGDLRPALNNVRSGLNEATTGFQQFNRQAQEVEQLKSQLGYFFSLTNSVYLLRSALQSAFETVKELDAVMTETAVVTDFSVGDMWEKLPEYAAHASDLGSSIKDVYAATTLYYQQGLRTNEAMSVGVETMKMARIAGMEAADATQAMTAALRGFNMEVNEANAKNVNDVYSNLAAITAADTEQIATAMSKTASIAASANMEFETTAALLAQIIETTQEAPETAGTALKTIIARFSEVKELQSQGKTTGEDSEGEAIDVNKIDKALSSVGISMDAFFAGTEGLDSVLMRLAEKWDTLDFTTQRYIATMAAGSRQQSRFIAMMSDYARTTELVNAANNSTGASQKQFDKTMESLEAKLNKLKVAWDQFTMGIADNQLIKTGIDLLTGLLETINKLLNGLPGLTKSFASLALVFVALRAGGALLNKALAGISGIVAKSFVDAGVVASKTAGAAGQAAGTKMALGTAKGVNNPAAQAALFKSYNLLLFRVQSTLPPVTIKTVMAPGSSAAVKSLWAEVNRLKIEEKQVAATYGKMSPQYQKIRKQRLLAAQAAQAARKANTSETLSIEGTTIAISKEMAAKIKEGAITKTQLALLGPEAAARVSNALAAGVEEKEIEELVWAKTTEENLRKGGLSRFFTEIGLRVMNKTAAKAESKGIWATVKAKLASAAAWVKANSAMLIGIATVAIYVAAIALLVVGIMKIKKAWDNAKNANKKAIDEMNNSVSEFTSQMQEAKEELNQITEYRTKLEDLQKGFENLTKGSKEWKQQLAESNQQVLELLNKYPTLASFITKGEYGQLTIKDEGWTAIAESAQQQYQAAFSGQIAAQMRSSEYQEQAHLEAAQSDAAQKQYVYDEYIHSDETQSAWGMTGVGAGAAAGAVVGSIFPAIGTIVGAIAGAAIGGIAGLLGVDVAGIFAPTEDEITRKETGMNKEDYLSFAAAAAENGMGYAAGTTREEYEALFKQMGLDDKGYNFNEVYENLSTLGTNFDKLAAQALNLQAAQETYARTLIEQIADNNSEVSNSEQRDMAEEITAHRYADVSTLVQEKAEALGEDEKYVDKDGEATDALINEYASINGMTSDEVRGLIADSKLSTETMLTSLAEKQVENEISNSLQVANETLNRMAALAKSQNKSIDSLVRVLSENGKDMTQEDLTKFNQAKEDVNKDLGGELDLTNEDHQKKVVEEYLASQGLTLQELGLVGGDDWKVIWNNLSEGSEMFADSVATQERLGLGAFDSRLGAQDSAGFTNKLQDQVNEGANTENARAISASVMSLLGDMTDEEAADFMSALNSVNWDDSESIENFSEKLKGLGFDMDKMGDKVENLEDDIKNFSDATYNLSDEEKAQLVDDTKELIDGILYEGRRVFTEDEKKNFGSEMQGKMVKIGSMWYIKDENITQDSLAASVVGQTQEKTYDVTGENAYRNKVGLQSTDEYTVDTYGSNIGYKYLDNGSFINLYNTKPTQYKNYSTTGDIVGVYKDQNGNLINPNFNAKNEEEFMSYFEEISAKDQGKALMSYYLTQVMGKTPAEAQEILNDSTKYQQSAKELYKWSTSQNEDQLMAFTLGAGAMYDNMSWGKGVGYKDVTKATSLGWENVQLGAFGAYIDDTSNGEVKGTQWEVLDSLFGENSTITGYEYEGKPAESGVVSNAELSALYKTIFPDGSETDPKQQQQALSDYYNNIKTNSADFTEEDYWQYYATTDYASIYAGTTDDFAPKAEAAEQVLMAYANNVEGVTGRVNEWKNSEADLVKQLKLNDNALRALALQTADSEKKFRNLSTVLNDNLEYLKAGPSIGSKYYEALENVTGALQLAFGGHITSDFVKEMLPQLEKLAAGGETAAAAFNDLAIAQAKAYAVKAMMSTAEGGFGWTKEQAAAYESAVAQLNAALVLNPKMNLYDFYQSLGDMAISYEDFAYAIANNPMYATLKIGVTMTANGLEDTGDGDKTNDIVSMFDWGSFFSGLGDIGGGGGSSSEWENPYDEFYNIVEKINEELRKREKLELRYQRLLDRNAATAAKIAELTREQLASLDVERTDREDLLKKRERQMDDIMSEYSDVGKYAKYNKEIGQIEIDWNLLEGLDGSTNEKLTSRIEEFISKLEEQQDLIEEEQDAIEEINDAVWEIYEQGKDEYFDLEEQVKAAIVADRQREIDKLSEINESINDTNSKLLDSIQQQLDEYRQNRDNEKTEEELSDKQRKLAYLQQDTSGANALEIMQLQKELDEATEDYTDTLIDQKISELQEQNDKAAEQRQQQIDIMQAQLDYYQESGAIWEEVSTLMEEGLDKNKGLIRGSRLETLLKEEAGFEGLSKLGKMNWLNELNGNIAQALSWLKGGAVQTLFGQGGTVTFTNADNSRVSGTVNADGDVVTDDGAIYSRKSFRIDANGNVTSSETAEQALVAQNSSEVEEEQIPTWPSGLTKPSQLSRTVGPGSPKSDIESVQTALKLMGYNPGTIDGIYGGKTKAAIKKFQADAKTNGWNPEIGSPDGLVGPRTKKAFANHPYAFKTGGLADFTGPAWLDGTKSRPEYVLNADQTKAFFNLVDVLGSLQSGNSKTTQNSGDNTYDIDINVESIGSDYDVEQLADTIKRLINEDARYRNNNAINLMR